MASATTPALAAEVSEAGGLGSLGLGTISADAAAAEIQPFGQMTAKPLNANFFCHEDPVDVTGTGETMRRRLAPFFQELSAGDVPDPGPLKRGTCGLEVLSGGVIRGPGPWAVVVHGAGAMVSMAGGIQSKCLAIKKAAMNAAIIPNKEKGLEAGRPLTH